jgi:hypothetical protein
MWKVARLLPDELPLWNGIDKAFADLLRLLGTTVIGDPCTEIAHYAEIAKTVQRLRDALAAAGAFVFAGPPVPPGYWGEEVPSYCAMVYGDADRARQLLLLDQNPGHVRRYLNTYPYAIAGMRRVLAQVSQDLLADLRPEQSGSDRLQIDRATQTVTLDGQAHHVEDPKAFLLYVEIAQSKGPLTRANLSMRIRGIRGGKTIPRLLGLLPSPLRKTIQSGTRGYWCCLPSLPEK